MTQDSATDTAHDTAPDEATPPTSPAPVTIAQRMASAGIGPERASAYLKAGEVQLDGEPVTDPATPAPRGETRWAINPA